MNGSTSDALLLYFKKKRARHLQIEYTASVSEMVSALVDKIHVLTRKNFFASIRGLHEQVNIYLTMSSYEDAHQMFILRSEKLQNVHERLAIISPS